MRAEIQPLILLWVRLELPCNFDLIWMSFCVFAGKVRNCYTNILKNFFLIGKDNWFEYQTPVNSVGHTSLKVGTRLNNSKDNRPKGPLPPQLKSPTYCWNEDSNREQSGI